MTNDQLEKRGGSKKLPKKIAIALRDFLIANSKNGRATMIDSLLRSSFEGETGYYVSTNAIGAYRKRLFIDANGKGHRGDNMRRDSDLSGLSSRIDALEQIVHSLRNRIVELENKNAFRELGISETPAPASGQ